MSHLKWIKARPLFFLTDFLKVETFQSEIFSCLSEKLPIRKILNLLFSGSLSSLRLVQPVSQSTENALVRATERVCVFVLERVHVCVLGSDGWREACASRCVYLYVCHCRSVILCVRVRVWARERVCVSSRNRRERERQKEKERLMLRDLLGWFYGTAALTYLQGTQPLSDFDTCLCSINWKINTNKTRIQ